MSESFSFSVLFLFISILGQLNGDAVPCEERVFLDMAKCAINEAKQFLPKCNEIHSYENTKEHSCGQNKASSAYLDVAKSLISKVKESLPACDDVKSLKLHVRPTDCSEILENGENISGIYEVWPKNRILANTFLTVYCDMETEGGGWTVIQRRGNFTPQEDFFRNWEDYKTGFGYIDKDFWLGNQNIFALTNQDHYTVRFDLEDVEGNKRYAYYDTFWIKDEQSNYTLHILNYSGNAGDSMAYHNNHGFSTKDSPDKNTEHCAQVRKGGWWYDYCTESNLNGLYQPGVKDDRVGITWYSFKDKESLAFVEIKIRRKQFSQIP